MSTPPLDRPGSRTQGLMLLAVIFLLGMVCGGAFFYAGMRAAGSPPPPWKGMDHTPGPPPDRGRLPDELRQMRHDLGLTDEQVEEIRGIIEQARTSVHETMEASRLSIRELLDDDQRERFDALPRRFPAQPRRGPPDRRRRPRPR